MTKGWIFLAIFLLIPLTATLASDEEKPVQRSYAVAPPAPMSQTDEEVAAKSSGCYSCHVETDQPSMH
ncbi:MAG TPA: hypothetical protein VJM79_06455, partial [Rhizorhapis sp.]|nr:hypothetical protein [Rhizorhapis sp.]